MKEKKRPKASGKIALLGGHGGVRSVKERVLFGGALGRSPPDSWGSIGGIKIGVGGRRSTEGRV